MDGTFQLGFTPIEQGKQVGLGIVRLGFAMTAFVWKPSFWG